MAAYVETSHSSAHAYCISATQTNKCFSCAKRKHLVSGVCVCVSTWVLCLSHHTARRVFCSKAYESKCCCAYTLGVSGMVCGYGSCAYPITARREGFVARHTSPSVVVHMHLVSRGMVCGYGSCAYPITARRVLRSKAYESKCCCAYTLGLGHGAWLWVLCLSHHPTACCDMSPWEVFCPVLESKTTSLLEH